MLVFAHPDCYRLPHALLEGETEGAVTPIAAGIGQLLDNNGLLGSGGLVIESHKMVDAEVVDISIVSCVLMGEIQTDLGAVGTNSLGQLAKGQVVL